ncbi:antitoxin Xre/MbcA/ParS toxin-binding domain-containing protein [Lysobacter soli]|uniref:antitoxin Xre/MbcA/ParS toxin-binding domain-containing protein n=1 Tax=Lysobacter soli TaxID=453783 RepID=UPI0037C600FB
MSEHVSMDLSTVRAAEKALRVYFRITLGWGLSVDEQRALLRVDCDTFERWRSNEVREGLDQLTLERLSHIFAIYAVLQVLLPIPERADAWVRRANSAPLFGGKAALDRMLSGDIADLALVRHYLEGQQQGWA